MTLYLHFELAYYLKHTLHFDLANVLTEPPLIEAESIIHL
jgi:hypothetical protein